MRRMTISFKMSVNYAVLDCHNEIPTMGMLKQQSIICCTSRDWNVQDQDAGTFGFWQELSSWP
jgi:hypothetical protein